VFFFLSPFSPLPRGERRERERGAPLEREKTKKRKAPLVEREEKSAVSEVGETH